MMSDEETLVKKLQERTYLLNRYNVFKDSYIITFFIDVIGFSIFSVMAFMFFDYFILAFLFIISVFMIIIYHSLLLGVLRITLMFDMHMNKKLIYAYISEIMTIKKRMFLGDKKTYEHRIKLTTVKFFKRIEIYESLENILKIAISIEPENIKKVLEEIKKLNELKIKPINLSFEDKRGTEE